MTCGNQLNRVTQMKLLLTTTSILIVLASFGQAKPTIYCFPGLGSNRHIFDSLVIDSRYDVRVIEYGTPDRGITLSLFAKQLSTQIDTTREFILIGVSLGGMICVELNEILCPKKTIIISSAKNRNELPARYRFQKAVPIYKVLPGGVLLAGAKILQPIVEPDRNKHRKIFKGMLKEKKAAYMKRTVNMIIDWDRTANSKEIHHIHGTNDHTLPIRKIKFPSHIVNKGSHMMTLTRAKDISNILNSILKQ